MKCLITGAGGLIGGYLAEYLVARDEEVIATDVQCSHVLDGLQGRLTLVKADISDHQRVLELVEEMAPDVIFHLAAQSFPQLSWEHPATTYDVNVGGTIHFLQAVTETELNPTIVVACSSGEYAVSTDGKPIPETGRLDPSSPYAVSKMVVDHFSRVYSERFDLRVIRARPFFLVGPRKKGDVCSDFARGILDVERGERDQLLVGNLDVVRDVMDVRDGVAALWALAEKGEAGEVYNICTGAGVCIGEILEKLKAMTTVPVCVGQDPARMRPLDEMVKIGDATKLKALGWGPEYTLDQTLADIMEYWREESTKCR